MKVREKWFKEGISTSHRVSEFPIQIEAGELVAWLEDFGGGRVDVGPDISD